MSVTFKDKTSIVDELSISLDIAQSDKDLQLPKEIGDFLEHIFQNLNAAKSGYLNLITCLICASVDRSVDPRYHRKPGRGMPEPTIKDGWFSGRTISEKVIYPWMETQKFRTAKSGWQTRTYERPNPYTLDYPENIALIKEQFLGILDYASKNNEKNRLLVAYLFRRELAYQRNKELVVNKVAKNDIGNEVLIIDIIDALTKHFATPSSAYLPVIAIYSIYQNLINEVSNYSKLTLCELESHQASDLRTGAVGDIELKDLDGDVIEGVEIKHGVEIDLTILLRAQEKILKSQLKRYYILTTHKNCLIDSTEILNVIRSVYKEHGCQIIINGVIPTIKYYLRMCENPSIFINNYSGNLTTQSTVTQQQLIVWAELQEHLNT